MDSDIATSPPDIGISHDGAAGFPFFRVGVFKWSDVEELGWLDARGGNEFFDVVRRLLNRGFRAHRESVRSRRLRAASDLEIKYRFLNTRGFDGLKSVGL